MVNPFRHLRIVETALPTSAFVAVILIVSDTAAEAGGLAVGALGGFGLSLGITSLLVSSSGPLAPSRPLSVGQRKAIAIALCAVGVLSVVALLVGLSGAYGFATYMMIWGLPAVAIGTFAARLLDRAVRRFTKSSRA